LNPEPRDYWGSGDSIVGEYAVHCDDVVECRTLRQLEHSSETWREQDGIEDGRKASGPRRTRAPSRSPAIFPPEADVARIVLVRHGEAECNLNHVIGGPKGAPD